MAGVFRVQVAGVQEIRRDVMSRACPDRTSAPVTSRLAWGSITLLHVVHVHVHVLMFMCCKQEHVWSAYLTAMCIFSSSCAGAGYRYCIGVWWP